MMSMITKPDAKWLFDWRKEVLEMENQRRSRLSSAFFSQPKDSRPLLERAREAASWGVPSNESIGFTQIELTQIISELIREIERLQHGR